MRVWLAGLWSRQVALLAEPKRVERVYMSTQGGQDKITCAQLLLIGTSNEICGGFLVHTMKHCAIRYICAYKFTARVKSQAYGRNAENEPVSRIKMADYRAVVSMGTL